MGFPSLIIIIILLLLLLQLSDGEPDEASADQSIAAIIEEPFLKEGGKGSLNFIKRAEAALTLARRRATEINTYIKLAYLQLDSKTIRRSLSVSVGSSGHHNSGSAENTRFQKMGASRRRVRVPQPGHPFSRSSRLKSKQKNKKNNGDLVSVLRGRSAPKRSLSYADVTLRASTGKKGGGIVGRALKKKKEITTTAAYKNVYKNE